MIEAADLRAQYEASPIFSVEEAQHRIRLPTDGLRSSARVVAALERPGVVRDALLTIGDVLMSDLRFKARDRADYLAYLTASGKKVTQAVWDAQKAFLEAQYGEAADPEVPLDPVVSVGKDGLSIEVFSRDESAYARLFLAADHAYRAESLSEGTTHIELNPRVLKSLGRIRSYRASTLELSPSVGGTEKKLRVPYRWLRAFGQVQAAAMLPADRFEIAPVDLYNVLLTLRRRKAKKPPRALRYELVPGQVPRLVIEPFNVVLEATGAPYSGNRPLVVRTWGRNRLSVLSRLLPHAKRLVVQLAGPGLPAYYLIDLGDAQLTLALSGWTDSGWAGIATFDLLVPGAVDELLERKVIDALHEGPKSQDQLLAITGRDKAALRAALLLLMQKGRLIFDLGAGLYRARALTAEPLSAEKLRYRDKAEEAAHRLLAVPDQVKLEKVHDLGAEGTAIEGEVSDQKAHRSYRTSFTLDREGRSGKATCSCPVYRRSGLREGPCEHMIALRLQHARELVRLEAARGTEEGRKLIRAETRTLIRRGRAGTQIYRLSLDERQVVVRWGGHPERMRMQRILFGAAEDARDAYFARLFELDRKGFIDASAAEQA
jgi:hypothetical protein